MFNKITLTTAFVASAQAKKLHMRDGDGSIPACTSYECKTDSATAGWVVPEEFTYGQGPDFVYKADALMQKESIPACTSHECKKASVADAYDVPTDNGIYVNGKDMVYKKSIPACTSAGCKTESAVAGWNVPSDSPYVYGPDLTYQKKKSLAQHTSVPACDSTGCKTASVAASYDVPSLYTDVRGDADHTYGSGYVKPHVYEALYQRTSVPACDSTGCKKGSVVDSYDTPSFYNDVRGDPDHTYGTGYEKHVYGLPQRLSVPACDSTGCKKGSVVDSYDVPSLNPDLRQGTAYTYGNSGLYQKTSVPACNSTGCKTASSASGWNVPTMSPEVYGINGEYSYATNDHKFLS